jgi:hypothetical protein
MPAASASMAAFAKDSYIIYKICFFHCGKGRKVFLGIVFADQWKKL